MRQKWSQTLYGELCTLFYDLDKPTAPELALEWYARKLAASAPILEPMCGSGRFLVPLIQRGLKVDGADPSPHMLAACKQKLNAAGLRARLWPHSLHEMAPGLVYDAAFIPASSFCLLHEPAAAAAGLARLRKCARRVLIEFELPQPGADWPKESSRTVTRGGMQIRLTSQISYDAASQVETHENTYELKHSGRVVQTEHETLRLRCYSLAQMTAALQAAGFEGVTIEKPEFGWVADADATAPSIRAEAS